MLGVAGADAAAAAAFAPALRDEDTQRAGGRLQVPPSFRVAVTSSFGADRYEHFLKEALPLQTMQPIALLDPSVAATSVSEFKAGEAAQGDFKAGQLQGDRTTLFLQG